MRIIFITSDFPIGSHSGSGVGTFVYNMSLSLAKHRIDSVILVFGQQGQKSKKIGEHITINYLHHISNIHYYLSKLPYIDRIPFILHLIKQWEVGKAIFQELKKLIYDTGKKDTLLEVPEGWGLFLGWKRNRLLPYVIVIHGSLNMYQQSIHHSVGLIDRLTAELYLRIMRGASAIICPSRFVFSVYEKMIPDKVFFSPNPVTLPELKNTRGDKENKMIDNQIVVLSVSALSWSKGIDTLQDAINKIGQITKDIRFVIVGSDGDIKKKDLDAFFCANQLSDIVQIVGYSPWEKIGDWYESCDIFVSTSRFETFGQTIAEAMLAGKPVIASKSGAIPELLGNGQCGILIDQGDSSSLAKEIIRLANDLNLRKELGSKGQAKILSEYSPERAIQERISIYKEILNQNYTEANK